MSSISFGAPASRALLIVLDGFGIGKDSPHNAIANAKMPFYRELAAKYPASQLLTHGAAVGLPDGVMGNSEVGHMTMGAGRIIYQDLSRISNSIAKGEFSGNAALRRGLETGARQTGRVHLMGLLSDGGVHSHIDHLLALLDLAGELGVPHAYVHAFLDGRDTPPNSSVSYLQKLLAHPAFAAGRAKLASIGGRYFAMDRDQRWDRVALAYAVLTGQAPVTAAAPLDVIQAQHAAGKSDEFLEPTLLDADGGMRDGDSVLFFNFRSDRAREITRAITEPDFADFPRGRGFKPSSFVGMTRYDEKLTRMELAFGPQNFDHIFGEWLEERKIAQFRIAETEKYAHVTFFFNGGREKPFAGEERLLVPSPKDVATYDLKPEMSAFTVAEKAAERLRQARDGFMLINFANADMVGHTGNYEAALRAMESLDRCLEQVVGAAQASGFHTLITADHGNAEEMCDQSNRMHTQHTLNPVPALWIAPGTAIAPQAHRQPLKDGGLQDIMPTLCQLMGLPVPSEVTGKSLLP